MRRFDGDHDGVLTVAEFQQALEKFGFQLAPEDWLIDVHRFFFFFFFFLFLLPIAAAAGRVEDHAALRHTQGWAGQLQRVLRRFVALLNGSSRIGPRGSLQNCEIS